MLGRIIVWTYKQLEPAEGWIPLMLLWLVVTVLAWAVTVAEWVPEGALVPTVGMLSLFLTIMIAKSKLKSGIAWGLIVGYGLVIVLNLLSDAVTISSLFGENAAPGATLYRNLLLIWIRFLSWLSAVLKGNRTDETVVFAFGLGILMWHLVAFVTWSVYRLRRPVPALSVLGVALSINSYFGDVSVGYIAGFILLAVLLTTSLHFAILSHRWESDGIDYSEEIQNDMLVASGVVAFSLMAIAFVLPSIQYRELAQRFADSAAVEALEGGLESAFAGVRSPSPPLDGDGPGGGTGAPRSALGVLPRSFLIGNPPELSQTVVMRAVVEGEIPAGNHWRGLSIDEYAAGGWRLSELDIVELAADETLTTPFQATRPISQTVTWALEDPAATRYMLGTPNSFNENVVLSYRENEDLVRAASDTARYTIQSSVSVATAQELQAADFSRTPDWIIERYTQLPGSVPTRVYDLAQEVAGEFDTPFDQARALEQFLRQYPYSLTNVELPPPGADPVDFFLFEMKTGYCDYYASAMVVMARALGIPARFAIGYVTREPESDGEQVIFEIHSHSWAEIYFPEYGWIEFEPTSGFSSDRAAAPTTSRGDDFAVPPELFDDSELPPIPVTPPTWWERFGTSVLLGTAILLLPLFYFYVFPYLVPTVKPNEDPDRWAYGKIQQSAQRLGEGRRRHETPTEFGQRFGEWLLSHSRSDWLRTRVARMQRDVAMLTGRFNRRQYARQPDDDLRATNYLGPEAWQRMRATMNWLWIRRLLTRWRKLR